MSAIEVKKELKSRRPKFLRSGATHIKRVSRSGYRKPKGLQNKVKDGKRGHRSTIKTGYGYPKIARGLTTDGKKLITVTTPEDVKQCTKDHVVIIDGRLGKKKKIALLGLVQEAQLTVYKTKDVAAYKTSLEESVKKAQDANSQRVKKRKDKKQAAENALKNKKAKPAKKEADVDQKKAAEAEKKEQDKVLITKE